MGIISGKVYKYHVASVDETVACYEPDRKKENMEAVQEAFRKAKQGVLFLPHLGLLEDAFLKEEILDIIRQEGARADYAIARVLDKYIEWFSKSEETMLKDKVVDLQDVKGHLLRAFRGTVKENVLAQIQEDVILVAKELLPSDILQMNVEHIKGIILERGSQLSHVAILARTKGIPMMTQEVGVWDAVEDGQLLEWEFTGKETSVAMIAELGGRLGINVDMPDWVEPDEAYDYIGLYRTEYQYIEAQQLPTEEELLACYKKAIEHAKGKTVTFRTIDIGGDKIPNYMKSERLMSNRRGIALCFTYPTIFKTQLRAILRATSYGKAMLMFPMVRSMEDIRCAKAYVQEAMQELEQEGVAFDKNVPIGIMIETCEMVEVIKEAVHEVDFASVGTNDLLEAISGFSREDVSGNMHEKETVERLFGILEEVFHAFTEAKKSIYVCGEMAAYPEYAKRLLLLGATGISVS